EIAAAEHRLLALALQGVAERGADAGEQLVHAEGFGHVIVGAQIERGDLRALATPDREHDDGHPRALPDLADEIEAVGIGQTKMEDDEIRRLGAERWAGGGGVVRLDDAIALDAEARAQDPADRGLVVDD